MNDKTQATEMKSNRQLERSSFVHDSGSACNFSAGERLINSAVNIARRRGDGHKLHDSTLINVIREMSATEIRESIGR